MLVFVTYGRDKIQQNGIDILPRLKAGEDVKGMKL